MSLRRSTEHKMIAGVAGGLAETLNVDPTFVRIGFVLFTIFGGAGTLIYLVLWAVIPRAQGGTIADEQFRKLKAWSDDRKKP